MVVKSKNDLSIKLEPDTIPTLVAPGVDITVVRASPTELKIIKQAADEIVGLE